MNNKELAASDALVKVYQIERFQILSNKNKVYKIRHIIYSKEQKYNTYIEGEATVVLDMIEMIYYKSRHITSTSIMIHNDNRLLIRLVGIEIFKENQFIIEARAKIAHIKQIIKESSISIEVQLILDHPKINRLCIKDSRLHLILLCDKKAKEVRVNTVNQNAISNVRYFGKYIIITN